MKIGILIAGHSPENLRPEHGEYDVFFQNLLAGQGFTFQTWFAVDGELPDDVHAADGWLISGSRHGAYEDLPFIPPLEDFIRAVYAVAVPLVGICFGHQIIAQALGGKVEKSDKGWMVGRQVYNFEGEAVALNAWHQDQVVELPKDAKVIAYNDTCPYAALGYGHKAFTVQAHPEFSNGFLGKLAESRGRGVVPDPLIDTAIENTEKPTDSAILARRIGAFFKQKEPQS